MIIGRVVKIMYWHLSKHATRKDSYTGTKFGVFTDGIVIYFLWIESCA